MTTSSRTPAATTSPAAAPTSTPPPTVTPAQPSSTHPDRLRALAGEQLARDRWSRDRLLDFQQERLRALIAHAVAASPYYRELLGPDAAAGDVPLEELPTLPKAMLMEHFDRVVTDPRLRLAGLEAHLAGADAARPYLGRYRVFSTAGTTGVRGLFVYDVDELAVWIGTCLRGLASWGLGPATRLAGIGSPSPLHISNAAYAVLLAGMADAAPRLAVTTPLPEMVAALNDFRPEALTAYPSVAAALAEEQLQGRLRIAPATVATSSEVQTADMRRRMAEAWEVAPLDFYGTTEALVPAAGRQGQTGRRWRGGGAPVPAAGAVLGAAGGPSVPGRPRPGRPARDRGPARGRPGGHPGPRRGRPGSRAARAGAVPPPVEVTPVAGIDRDPGHGAKLKLVRNAVSGR